MTLTELAERADMEKYSIYNSSTIFIAHTPNGAVSISLFQGIEIKELPDTVNIKSERGEITLYKNEFNTTSIIF